MNAIVILKWFINKYPELYKQLRVCTHHYGSILNPYHIEGDVLTHTLMVFNLIKNSPKYSNNVEMLLVGLLHDIGKIRVRTEVPEKNKVHFANHPMVSTFMAYSILKDFEKDFNITLDKVKILSLINWHDIIWACNKESMFKDYLAKFKGELDILKGLIDFMQFDNNGMFNEKTSLDSFMPLIDTVNSLTEQDYVKDVSYDSNKPDMVFLIGVPCSGKSTFLKENSDRFKEHVTISFDNSILETCENSETTYNDAYHSISRDELKKIEKQLFEKIKDSVKERKNIVIDQTNLSPKSRRSRMGMVSTKVYNFVADVFLIDYETFKDRDRKRTIEQGKTINDKVLNSMLQRFTLPLPCEFSKINYHLF